MRAMLWRLLFAVIAVLVLLAAIPLFLRIIGFPIEGDAWALTRIIIAALALLYVVAGPTPKGVP